ncbi:MAG: dTDP-4-dehydrorhamnose 3,5-epimerase family protein [Treponema sp.]
MGKLVRAISGRVYDVAVDLRNSSPSFGMYYGIRRAVETQSFRFQSTCCPPCPISV